MSNFISKISSIRRNPEAKTVASNFMWLSALQVAGYVFPLITMPYLARVIGVDGFGKIAFAAAIMVWIQTITDWGFNLTAIRDVAQNRDNKEKVSDIFSNVLWARCLLMFASLIILLVAVCIIPQLRAEWDVILISFLMIPGHVLFPDWFFQAVERMKYTSILNVLTKLFFTLAVFIFIKKPQDYLIQPLLTSIGFIISGLISLYIIIVKWEIKLKKPDLGKAITCLKESTNVFVNHLLPNLYNSFSTILVGIWGGGNAVGILDGGNKFVQVGNQVINSISRAFYPFLSRKIDKHNLYIKVNIGITTLIALLFFIAAPYIVDIFLTPEFCNSSIIIRIRAVSMIFYAISMTYGNNYILINHQDKLLRQISVKASIIGFIIAWPLVYHLSYIGASITVTISLGLMALFSYIGAKKIQKLI